MAFPTLTFPIQVDFGQTVYWIGDAEPFRYGEAVTAFFASELTADGAGDELLLMHRLEDYLQAFGEHLQPYVLDRSYNPSVRARVILYPKNVLRSALPATPIIRWRTISLRW